MAKTPLQDRPGWQAKHWAAMGNCFNTLQETREEESKPMAEDPPDGDPPVPLAGKNQPVHPMTISSAPVHDYSYPASKHVSMGVR